MTTTTKPKTTPDGSLPLALTQLADAIHHLTGLRPALCDNKPVWLPSRYDQLRQALTEQRDGGRSNQAKSLIPLWIDALKLLIDIDNHLLLIIQMPRLKWRPQDTHKLVQTTNQIHQWIKAIDDLFAPKPVYLPNPCPQCNHTHAYRLTDDGERIRTPALSVTAERGATCTHCHATWPPERLMLLGRILGYRQPEGVL